MLIKKHVLYLERNYMSFLSLLPFIRKKHCEFSILGWEKKGGGQNFSNFKGGETKSFPNV